MTPRDQAIDICKNYCRDQFKDEQGVEVLPPAVVVAVDRMMQFWNNSPAGVTSVTQEGAGGSGFDTAGALREVERYLLPLRRPKLL